MATFAAILASELVDTGSRAVTDAMTLFTTVVAHDGLYSLSLTLLLGAPSGGVAQLLTVGALGNAAVDNFTGILKALQVLLRSLGPNLALTRAGRVGTETISDSVLLVHIALEVHVGHGLGNVGLFDSDEVHTNLLAAKSLLKLDVGGVRSSLDIRLNSLLDIIEVTALGCGDNALPGVVRRHVGVNIAINLAGLSAGVGTVAYELIQVSQGKR